MKKSVPRCISLAGEEARVPALMMGIEVPEQEYWCRQKGEIVFKLQLTCPARVIKNSYGGPSTEKADPGCNHLQGSMWPGRQGK